MEDYIKIIYTLQQKKKPTPAKVPQAGGWGKGESEWPGAVEMDDAMDEARRRRVQWCEESATAKGQFRRCRGRIPAAISGREKQGEAGRG